MSTMRSLFAISMGSDEAGQRHTASGIRHPTHTRPRPHPLAANESGENDDSPLIITLIGCIVIIVERSIGRTIVG